MAYVPNNVQVYTAAFTGAASGISQYRKTKSVALLDFRKMMQVADALAQAVDTVWAGTPTILDVDSIAYQVEAQFIGGFPLRTDASFYSATALSIVTQVQAAQNQYAVEGITPPPLPSSGPGATLPITDGAFTAVCDTDVGGGEKNLIIGSNATQDAAATYKFVTWLFKDSMDFGLRGGASTVRVDVNGMQVGNGKNLAIVQGQPLIDYHGGAGVFFWDEATSTPVAAPATGLIAYVENAAIKYRNPDNDVIVVSGPTSTLLAVDLNIDWADTDNVDKTLALGANVITFSNVGSSAKITIAMHSDAGGSTVTWPVTVKWFGGGGPPTQTPTGTDVYTFIKIGATVYGSVLQDAA